MNSRYSTALSLLCLVSLTGLTSLMAAGSSNAATLYVSTRTGADKGNGASWATAFKTLTPALREAKPGDEIWVAAGLYPGNYTLRSGVRLYGGFHGDEKRRFDRDWRKHDTFLDGREDAPVVTLNGGETPYPTVLDGFTIRDGKGRFVDGRRIGGGVLVIGAVRALIAHNVIRNNSARGQVNAVLPQVADGGGIGLIEGASAVIKDNFIVHNAATRNGGGIAVWDASNVSITNNTLLHNTAANGGGMAFEEDNVHLLNNLVAYNSSGLFHAGKSANGPEVKHHLLNGNEGYNYSGWADRLEDETTNVFSAPVFADAEHGNYRPGKDSPARNAGSDAAVEAGDQDVTGQSRILMGTVDIGALEGFWPTRQIPLGSGTITREFTMDVAVVHVNPYDKDANDYNTGSTWDKPKSTLTAAIDAARLNGGVVKVFTGNYNERIFLPPGVRLRGGYTKDKNGDIVQEGYCTIGGEPGDRVGLAMLGPDAQIEVFGFNGGPAVVGGEGPWGLYRCTFRKSPSVALRNDGGSPTIRSCFFYANRPAIESTGGAPEILICRFIGNAGEDEAGAIVINGGGPVISDCVFAGNVGGAVSMREALAHVVNNTFYGNHGYTRFVSRLGDVGETAGAVESVRSALTFANNIVAGNTGGVQNRYALAGFPIVRNNCVFQNAGFDWRLENLPDPSGSNGNFRADPRMVAPQHGRFEVLPTSPCYNTGDSSLRARATADTDGQARLRGHPVDMGGAGHAASAFRPRLVACVKPDGNDANTGVSWNKALRTIGKALERLQYADHTGGEIWVARGQYREPVILEGFSALYGGFSGREERREQRDPEKNITELLGNGNNPPITIMPGAPFNVVDGFTIRGGFGTAYAIETSGGIVCHPGSTSVIANNILQDNHAEYGHALGADHAWVTLTGNTITGNSAVDGTADGSDGSAPFSGAAALFNHSLGVVSNNVIEANSAIGLCFLDRSGFLVRDNLITKNVGDAGGILTWQCFGEISNNIITANTATRRGGGLALESSMEYIHDNLVTANTSVDLGGGIHSTAGNPLLVNNTVMRNTAKDAGAAYLHNAGMLYNNIFAFNSSGLVADKILTGRNDPTLVMRLNCVFGNAGYETRGLPKNGYVSENFSEDPRFKHTKGEEFRLDQQSPCIDRGTDAFLAATDRDIDGQPRLIGEAVDIGADERPEPEGVNGVRRPRGPTRPPLSATGQRIPGGLAMPGGAQRPGALSTTRGRLR